ncbi:MAG: asparagine synthase (glutamine-hydrolyzing) [Bacteroidota bacterium]
MCGIAGYFHFDKEVKADPALLKSMTDCIAYRGPDGEGFYVYDNMALGHRRLSIIDLNTGDQPMYSEDGNKIVVFNGEIYNYIELREELTGLGHKFKTSSDTEVLIKSYEQWGHECQNKFNGMWAFALWDKSKQELFLSRDRIGEKPLSYCVYNNTFIFGSEIKSILKYGVPKEIRPELTELYLALTNIPAPDTFYRNIYKLRPGHYLIVKDGNVSEKMYWQFPQINEKDMLINKQEIYQKFEEILSDAVKIRMRSDVAFGAFLSGGLDSSGIVSIMANNSRHPVKTFTIGFNDKAFDESELAAEVAGKFKTEHSRGTVLPDNFKEAVNKVALHYDEPFGDSSAIPTDFVSRYAAQKVKMVLTGDGGDEALSGYTAYKGIKVTSFINNNLPGVFKKIIIGSVNTAAKVFKGSLRYKLNKISNVLQTSNLPFHIRVAEKIACTSLKDIKTITKNIPGVIAVETYFESLLQTCRFKDDFYKLMYVHYLHNLPNDYLVKVDRMSMANSIETRVPFLDFRLIEFMATVHKDVKMQGWELKSVLRNSIGKNLPASVLNAPKRGFGIPLREWFKEEGFNDLLEENLQKVKEMLDRDTINKIVTENKEGKKDNGNFIWALIQLNKFLP